MMTLEASTALPYTVPGTNAQSYRACFSTSSTADVWVCNNGTATLPTSDTATAIRYQQRIGVNTNLFVRGGDVLSFISTGTPQVGISFLKMPQYT